MLKEKKLYVCSFRVKVDNLEEKRLAGDTDFEASLQCLYCEIIDFHSKKKHLTAQSPLQHGYYQQMFETLQQPYKLFGLCEYFQCI